MGSSNPREGALGNAALYVLLFTLIVVFLGAVLWFGVARPSQVTPTALAAPSLADPAPGSRQPLRQHAQRPPDSQGGFRLGDDSTQYGQL